MVPPRRGGDCVRASTGGFAAPPCGLLNPGYSYWTAPRSRTDAPRSSPGNYSLRTTHMGPLRGPRPITRRGDRPIIGIDLQIAQPTPWMTPFHGGEPAAHGVEKDQDGEP